MKHMHLCLLAGTMLIAGCEANSASRGPSGPGSGSSRNPAPIELKDTTLAELDGAIASHKGSVVAVDVWGTFCPPCVKRFPHFVEMHRRFADRGLVCISLSTDLPEAKNRARDFLVEHHAEFENYWLNTGAKSSPELEAKYPLDEQPMMYVFNRKGEKVMQFVSHDKPEQIDAAIAKLLDEK